MVDKQLKHMSAVQLKIALIALMVVLLAAGGGLFWFIRQKLVEQATLVQTVKAEANNTSSDIIRLQALQKTLEEDKVAITRAKNIIVNTTDDEGKNNYDYQDKIIDDLTAYSAIADVPVLSITFLPQATDGTTAAPDATGLKKITVTITLGGSTTYRSIMHFISLIENNLTKMQITGVPLVNSTPGTDETTIDVSTLTLEIYTR